MMIAAIQPTAAPSMAYPPIMRPLGDGVRPPDDDARQ
jgi:hypothetical protein